jgi:peroxidase
LPERRRMTMRLAAAVVVMVVVAAAAMSVEAELSVDYYKKSCPGVENVVRYHVAKALKANRKEGAALVRLIFHDCFVRVIISIR